MNTLVDKELNSLVFNKDTCLRSQTDLVFSSAHADGAADQARIMQQARSKCSTWLDSHRRTCTIDDQTRVQSEAHVKIRDYSVSRVPERECRFWLCDTKICFLDLHGSGTKIKNFVVHDEIDP